MSGNATGEHRKAVDDFTRVLKYDPDQPAALNLRGVAHAELDDHDRAAADFTRAGELDPEPGRRDLPVMSWPNLLPGVYLGVTPDLSPGTPLRSWLERTNTPFYILTNYASPTYTDQTGPATYQALTGPLAVVACRVGVIATRLEYLGWPSTTRLVAIALTTRLRSNAWSSRRCALRATAFKWR